MTSELGEFDADIDAMDLDVLDKFKLQLYRTYTKAFETHAIERFVKEFDEESHDVDSFNKIVELVIKEDPRFIPVITCAFADELLTSTFKNILPDGIPGGKGNMFGAYGPLSSLSKLIQIAYAFDVLSGDLLEELDRLRSARNLISHSWDIASLDDFFTKGRLADMHRMEELLPEREGLEEEFSQEFQPLEAFRIRVVWISGRLQYEAAAYNRSKVTRVRPSRVLYGKPTPKLLTQISSRCLQATREIVKRA